MGFQISCLAGRYCKRTGYGISFKFEKKEADAVTGTKKTENGVMMQYFEWYLPPRCGLWNRLKEEAAGLAEKGITALWLPPAYKGYKGDEEVGYAVYDLYDLGEFDQKGTVATKYGTMEEYLAAVEACHEAGIQVYTDIVFNQMVEGDETEKVMVVEYDPGDRTVPVSEEEKMIYSLSKFTFPGRDGTYSTFTWDHTHFTGSDKDERNGEQAVYRFSGSEWSADVDDENGNFDYLLGLDVNFGNPEVVEYLTEWGEWYLDTVNPDGFRLDALKHIDRSFFPDWLKEMREYSGKELFTVGEYWKTDVTKLKAFLDDTGECMSLFDVPLHYAFHNISHSFGLYDLSQIFSGTLTAIDPVHSVTFVDNHDTQPGQALDSSVESWFVPLAYALILLRREGYPCIFYGDYYGLEARNGENFKGIIDEMLDVRKNALYGERHDWFDDPDVIGWTYEGDKAHKNSGTAVILSDHGEGEKRMYAGISHAGETWIDRSGNGCGPVEIDEDGYGIFRCPDGGVSFYTKQEAPISKM